MTFGIRFFVVVVTGSRTGVTTLIPGVVGRGVVFVFRLRLMTIVIRVILRLGFFMTVRWSLIARSTFSVLMLRLFF